MSGSCGWIADHHLYHYYKRLKSILMCTYVYFTAVQPQSNQTAVMISGWLCCEMLILTVHWCDRELPQLPPTCSLTCANVSSLCPTKPSNTAIKCRYIQSGTRLVATRYKADIFPASSDSTLYHPLPASAS